MTKPAPFCRRMVAVVGLLPLLAEAARFGLGSQIGAEEGVERSELFDPKHHRPLGAAVVPSGPKMTAMGLEPPVSLVPPDYKSAGVVFYTRDTNGSVSHVLFGVRFRDVNLKELGKDDDGVVSLPLLQVPMGERYPKKVEGWAGTIVGRNFYDTAQKWWIVETADAAGLSKYLEMAATGQRHSAMSCHGADGAQDIPPAMYHSPSRMALVFCQIGEPGETPPTRGKKPQRMDLALGPWKWSTAVLGQEKGKSLFDPPKSWAKTKESRRRPDDEQATPDELRLTWVPASQLRGTLKAGLEGADITTSQGRHPLHPFTRRLFMVNDVRRWLRSNTAPASSSPKKHQDGRSTAREAKQAAKPHVKSQSKPSVKLQAKARATSTANPPTKQRVSARSIEDKKQNRKKSAKEFAVKAPA